MTTAIIVAAGWGTRMGPDVDKLFLSVAGRPLIAHTWKRFDDSPWIDDLVLVVRNGMQNAFAELAAQYAFRKYYQLVQGGAERQDSVWNGLQAVGNGTELVAIQDGARPCATDALIAATLQAAREMGAAVAAQRVTDTVKESDGNLLINRNVDRTRLWAVQTPQCFRVEILRRALETAGQQGWRVTDDAAACEIIGQPVKLVESTGPNPKVTVPGDLAWVEWLLANS